MAISKAVGITTQLAGRTPLSSNLHCISEEIDLSCYDKPEIVDAIEKLHDLDQILSIRPTHSFSDLSASSSESILSLDDENSAKSDDLKTLFFALPIDVQILLYIITWRACGSPLGNYRFGEDILLSDISLLKKIKTEEGVPIITALIQKLQNMKHERRFLSAIHSIRANIESSKMRAVTIDLCQKYRRVSDDPRINDLLRYSQGHNGKSFSVDIQSWIPVFDGPKTLKELQNSLLVPISHEQTGKEAVSLSADAARGDPKRVLMVASECSKIAKCGGLGEAVYGVSKSLRERGYEVDLLMPKYDVLPASVTEALEEEESLNQVYDGIGKVDRVFRSTIDGLTVHFVEDSAPKNDRTYRDHFEIRSIGNLYENGPRSHLERMAYFGISAASFVDTHKEEYDAVLFHDWHGAWGIDRLGRRHFQDWLSGKVPAMGLIVHNNNYTSQGQYYGEDCLIPTHFGERSEELNLMLRGMGWADHVITVSPTFAVEMQSKTLGAGIDPYVRKLANEGKLSGILNGSNPELWNPRTDPQLKNWIDPETGEKIDLTYDPCKDDVFEKKSRIGEQLQKWVRKYHPEWIEENGIDFTKGRTMLYVGRYDSSQKGLDKFGLAQSVCARLGINFVCMGIRAIQDLKARDLLTQLDTQVKSCKTKEGGKGLVIQDYRNASGKLEIQQGSDEVPGVGALLRSVASFMFIPSEFEPCGLVQYEGWLFGSVVIATATGGLADTVHGPDSPYFNGYTFERCEDWRSEEQDENITSTIVQATDHWKKLSRKEKKRVISTSCHFARKSSWKTNPIQREISPVDQYIKAIDKMIERQKTRIENLSAVKL